ELESVAEVDVALPIGNGQTISQPLVVAFMLELLDPQRDQKILDVGSGSGWTTALLSYIVGNEGKVFGIENIN
ncbi:L-isoaspartyl protein carboxyl methyltransferase, partial [Candidatus Shapirobacteria bacterium CG09_land_8_20_14_0_10_39_12]